MNYTDDLSEHFQSNNKNKKYCDNMKHGNFFIKEFTNNKNMNQNEINKIFKFIKSGSKDSIELRNKIIKSYLRLVISIAKKYTKTNPRTQLIDSISNGIMGLLRAAEKYDPSKFPDILFHTYASHWIKSKILKDIVKENRQPETFDKKSYKNNKGMFQLALHSDENNINVNIENKIFVKELLSHLTLREQYIIKLRFGIVDEFNNRNKKMNLADIGNLLDPPISLERVRQIEAEALRKMRNIALK